MLVEKCIQDRYSYCCRDCKTTSCVIALICKNCGKEFYSYKTRQRNPEWIDRTCGWDCKYELVRKQNTQLTKEELHYRYGRWGSDNAKRPDVRKKISDSKLGDNNPMKRPEVRAKVSEWNKNNWKQLYNFLLPQSLNALKLAQIAPHDIRPNKTEQKVLDIINKHNLPFEYVGNHSFWVGPCKSGKRRNPDFVHTDHYNRKAILFNGRHWHSQEKERIEKEDYESKGYDVLVLHEEDLIVERELVAKIKHFTKEVITIGME